MTSSTFVSLRVLVTLVATLAILSSDVSSRPVPSPSMMIRRSPPQVPLISTSGMVSPPLPAMVQRRDEMRADRFKMANVYRGKARALTPSGQDDEQHKRDSNSHEHVHVREHIHGDYSKGYPDWWTSEMIKHHHSQHWAEHHGLVPDGHVWTDGGHVHEHIHEHIHKRGDELMDERGLIGDLVRPLLAPLNVIPGFVTISNLLFGDGVTDGGLLKKLGGLVLHVEKAQEPSSDAVYSFSLMASKNDRTQVYLAPANQTGTFSASDSNETSDGSSSSSGNDTIAVKITLPLLGANGTAVLMCASYAVAPPSALNLEACRDDGSAPTNQAIKTGSSQLFAYTPSSGSLEPMYSSQEDQTDPVEAAVTLSTSFKAATPIDEKDKSVSVSSNNVTASNATTTTSSTPASTTGATDGKTKTKVLMQFTPISAMSSTASMDTTESSVDAMPISEKMETTNATVAGNVTAPTNTTTSPSASMTTPVNSTSMTATEDFPQAAVASPSTSTLIEITQVVPALGSSPLLNLNKSYFRRAMNDASDGEASMANGDETIDDQSTNPTVVTKEDLLTNKPATVVDSSSSTEGEDDTSQILLAETTLANTKATISKAAKAKAPRDPNHCPCFAEK